MATCPKCSTRKAKRSCPALAQTICPQCCAELRMIELACPESCPYLKEARTATAERHLPKLMQYLTAKDKRELFQVLVRFEVVIFLLQRAIIEVQRHTFRDLEDEEVGEGVKNALKTYETLDHGIIYEHASESPRVQAVSRAILDALDDLKKRLEETQQSAAIKSRDVLSCLEFLSEAIQFERESGKNKQAWLHHTALYQPYPQEETQSVIIPG